MEHLQSNLTIAFAQLSDAGRKTENQDTLGARLPEGQPLTTKGIAMAVADGVSSSQAAREASQTAITGFLTDYYATPDTWRTELSAVRVIESLNRSLWGLSRNSLYGDGFLTTFSALILKGETGYIFHVGDTRVGLWRNGHLEQLTRDHSQRISRHQTYLSRALGADLAVEVDTHAVELQVGDVFVLTSDGIHDSLAWEQLRDLMAAYHDNPNALVAQVLDGALEAGSEDNLSIQVARIEQLGQSDQSETMQRLSRLPFPPLLKPGQALDGLIVQRILHESNRSQIYLVKNAEGRQQVMKTPSRLQEDDPAYIERFAMEAWIGARIASPFVVRVAPPNDRSCLYYLTEYVPGPTLAEVLAERGQLPVPDAVEMISFLIRGVRAFHRKETLHQDLKPDNIVLSQSGPVIVDFGSCWVAGIEEIRPSTTQNRLWGTLDYAAPEYRYGGPIGPRSDQFSLALLLYQALTGKHPYGSAFGKAAALKQFQKLRYQPASAANPLVPHWLDKALEKALSVRPGDRYEALSEWLQDLQRPNPRWENHRRLPLIERYPKRVWPALALVGWLLAIALLAKG